MKYTIQKAKSKEDYDNGNFYPSDGGKYDAYEALRTLEIAHGGVMQDSKGAQFGVSYNKSENEWLRKRLKV